MRLNATRQTGALATLAIALAAFQFVCCGIANAGSTLDAIRTRGFVQCASVQRPGLATRDEHGRWSGLEVELCRAIATAVFGVDAHFAYHGYDTARDFDILRRGEDDVAFLTKQDIADATPSGMPTMGPTIFVETYDLIVALNSPLKRAIDLTMKPVCFITATPVNESLDAWFETKHIPLIRFAFREEDEMYDAYNVQRCVAVAGETTELARARLSGGVNHLQSRFLPDHLTSVPIVATTPSTSDANWATIVNATVYGLIAGGATPKDNGLGLATDWRKLMLDQVGNYDAIFARTVGMSSPLRLDRGLNGALALGAFEPPSVR